MAYTASYREWRPKTFSEVVGQEHITTTLKNQVKNNKVAHAYLLCGTRGTGKTSTAKILSKAVNCLNPIDGEPCNQCEMCKKINAGIAIDVTELDAASHNSVDNIRDIIEEVKYPPRESKYRVYIMDEVHMLSTGAVNAFLKTLEEPPENVIFILATTDQQKLPMTILSRCQRFDFKRISSEDIFKRLRVIAKDRGVFIEDKSLNLIAKMSDGAMRDALSLFDQSIAMGNGKVEYNQVVSMLGLVTNDDLVRLTDNIIDKNIENSMKVIENIISNGKDISVFMKDMINHMRNLMMIKVCQNPEDVIDMSEENLAILRAQSQKIRIEEIMRNIRILQEYEEQSKWSNQSRIYLELSVIKMCKIEYDTSKEVILSRINKLEKIIKEGNIKVNLVETKEKIEDVNAHVGTNDEILVDDEEKADISMEMINNSWKDILELLKSRRFRVIEALLSNGRPAKVKDGVLYIVFSKEYAFSKNNLEKPDNYKKLQDIFREFFKQKIAIKFFIEEDITSQPVLTENMLKDTFGEGIIEIIDE